MFFEKLNASTVVLTPNRRLTATLHKLYHQYRINDAKCWETPRIMPIASWFQQIWNEYNNKNFNQKILLLNSNQELFLWQQIITDSKAGGLLLQPDETASSLQSAWRLLKEWNIVLSEATFDSALEFRTIFSWMKNFKDQCMKMHWIDQASLPDFLAQKIQDHIIQPPSTIILVGFIEINPQLQRFLNIYQECHFRVEYFNFSKKNSSTLKIKLKNSEHEIRTIAAWAKKKLEDEKNIYIGCVIPALDKIRDRVKQIFSETFANKDQYLAHPLPFNLSAGKSLSHYPIIHTALILLSLPIHTLFTETLSYLLRSPHLGEAESEYLKRSLLIKTLRQKNLHQFYLNEIATHPEIAILFDDCPKFYKRLRSFFTKTQDIKNQTHSEWAYYFNELLYIMGWPGERSLNSEEFQVVDRWQLLLNEFSSLDYVASPLSYQSAFQCLRHLANQAIFQTKTPDAPIQILGVLEASGVPFDYLWIASMDDQNWPPAPKPHPLLPKKLQHDHQMPHATSQRELNFCQTLLKHFQQNASEIVFSYAEKKENLALNASPFLKQIPEITDALFLNYSLPADRVFESKILETIVDNIGHPIQPTEKIQGGISLLRDQALCPFKAYVGWRFKAHPLEQTLPGFKSKDRGVIIHQALELLWQKLKDHYTLCTINKDNLYTLIHSILDQVLSPYQKLNNTQYLLLEKKRLFNLIQECLEIEKSRPPFTVLEQEKKITLNLNQLTLSLRIDRVDQLENGKKLIIDYKTTRYIDIKNWFGDRPEEPQLPLYLLESQDSVGITFAQINPGNYIFKGASSLPLEIKGIKTLTDINKNEKSWAEQLVHWRQTFIKISEEFYQGMADVEPKDAEITCLQCHLQPLCRIYEESL